MDRPSVPSSSPTIGNTRVDKSDRNVHDEVRRRVSDGDHEGDTHHRRPVQVKNGLDGESAQSRPGKDRLREHGAGEQRSNGEAEDG